MTADEKAMLELLLEAEVAVWPCFQQQLECSVVLHMARQILPELYMNAVGLQNFKRLWYEYKKASRFGKECLVE